jgi:hypothetical protein
MKLRPNDVVTIGWIAWEIGSALPLFYLGQWVLGGMMLIFGIIVAWGLDRYENRIYRKGAKISWLDYMRIRDLMAHGHNYEAILFTLNRAYGMDESQIQALKPEDLNTLMEKLKIGENQNV